MKTPWGETEELRALRLTPGRGSRGPAAWIALKRRRFLAALVAGLAEKSYAELTIADLERLSGCGRDEFYRVFESKEDCLLQAVDALYEHALARTAAAYAEAPGPWRRRLAAAFAELIGILADQRDAGRMVVVDVYAAGAPGRRGAGGPSWRCSASSACCAVPTPRRAARPCHAS